MQPHSQGAVPAQTPSATSERLSYKFQRLRERLRNAIVTGELSGKLPGERVLAQRFDANPKTLSKALTDLAAEGLLDRSIGRGTYVKGHTPADHTDSGKWLILGADFGACPIIPQILKVHADTTVDSGSAQFRPSFINQFAADIDFAPQERWALHRDLAVRGVPTVIVGHEPQALLTPGILIDKEYAALCLGRRLLLTGKRQLVAVEAADEGPVHAGLTLAAQRYEPGAVVTRISAADLHQHSLSPDAVLVCDGAAAAQAVQQALAANAGSVTSVLAIGCTEHAPCSGYYVTPQQIATAVVDLLRAGGQRRPMVLWLLGDYVEAAGSTHSGNTAVALTA